MRRWIKTLLLVVAIVVVVAARYAIGNEESVWLDWDGQEVERDLLIQLVEAPHGVGDVVGDRVERQLDVAAAALGVADRHRQAGQQADEHGNHEQGDREAMAALRSDLLDLLRVAAKHRPPADSDAQDLERIVGERCVEHHPGLLAGNKARAHRLPGPVVIRERRFFRALRQRSPAGQQHRRQAEKIIGGTAQDKRHPAVPAAQQNARDNL